MNAGVRVGTVTLPFWMPILPLGIGIALVVRKEYRADLRAMRGCCRACGYDLSGVPHGVNRVIACPECGQSRRSRKS